MSQPPANQAICDDLGRKAAMDANLAVSRVVALAEPGMAPAIIQAAAFSLMYSAVHQALEYYAPGEDPAPGNIPSARFIGLMRAWAGAYALFPDGKAMGAAMDKAWDDAFADLGGDADAG